jgi:hypothetical protein
LSEIYNLLKGVDNTKIIAWATVLLVLVLLQRGAMLRGRIRYEEDSYLEAIKLLSELESPLHKVVDKTEENLARLFWDCRSRFPQVLVNEVLGSTAWVYRSGTIEDAGNFRWEEFRELGDLQSYEDPRPVLKEILDAAIKLHDQGLWNKAHRLLARVGWEFIELDLSHAAAVVEFDIANKQATVDRLALQFMAPERVLELTKERARYRRFRYAARAQRHPREHPRIDLEQLDDSQRARLRQDLSDEARQYSETCKEWLAQAVVAALCAKRIAYAIADIRFASGPTQLASRVFSPSDKPTTRSRPSRQPSKR